MWDRLTIKTRAKDELRVSYWTAFLVVLCFIIIISIAQSIANSIVSLLVMPLTMVVPSIGYSVDGLTMTLLALMLEYLAMAISFLGNFAATSFATLPLFVGVTLFFMRAPYGDRKFEYLFWAFQNNRYLKVFKVMFFTYLKVSLGFLVIVPGVMWFYTYRFVPNLVAENPDLTPKEAMEISHRLTYGHKMDIFIFDLSFILWVLGCVFTCCIGFLFFYPYPFAANAQLYFILRGYEPPPPPPPKTENNYYAQGGQPPAGPGGQGYPPNPPQDGQYQQPPYNPDPNGGMTPPPAAPPGGEYQPPQPPPYSPAPPVTPPPADTGMAYQPSQQQGTYPPASQPGAPAPETPPQQPYSGGYTPPQAAAPETASPPQTEADLHVPSAEFDMPQVAPPPSMEVPQYEMGSVDAPKEQEPTTDTPKDTDSEEPTQES